MPQFQLRLFVALVLPAAVACAEPTNGQLVLVQRHASKLGASGADVYAWTDGMSSMAPINEAVNDMWEYWGKPEAGQILSEDMVQKVKDEGEWDEFMGWTIEKVETPATPAPAPDGCDDSTSGTCSIYEDPHIEVFDGNQISLLRVTKDAENFTGGDKWLVKSARVSIQGRYVKDDETPERNMFMQAIAIGGSFLGGNKIIVGPLEAQILWNDVPVLRNDESLFQVEERDYFVKARRGNESSLVGDLSQANRGVNIELPLGVKLVVNRLQHHVNVAIKMCRQAGQDGLCGNFNGFAADDALEIQAARSVIDLTQEESLFVCPKQAPCRLS